MVERDFEALFRVVFPRLVSLGTLKTGRVDVARDLAQETMLRAHARWDHLAGYDSPAAWCHTVMTNLLVDHHRSAAAGQRAVERLLQWVATVTTSNLFDDSAAAVRWELELARGDDGRFGFVSGEWSQACQPDRGHQDFTAKICV